MADIAFDAATAHQSAANASSDSFSHTVGSLANGVLLVTVGYFNRSRSVTGITFNGVAMTLYRRYENGSAASTNEVWRLVNPAAGAHTVAVTMDAAVGAGTKVTCIAASYANVDQTTPIDATHVETVSTGTHSTHTNSITPQRNNAMLIGALFCGSAGTAPTATGSGQTARASQNDGAADSSALGEIGPVATPASKTMSWSWTSQNAGSNQILFELVNATSAIKKAAVAFANAGFTNQ